MNDKTNYISRFPSILTIAALVTFSVSGQSEIPSEQSAISQPTTSASNDSPLDELTFVEMLNSVDLGKNYEIIQKFQEKEAKTKLFAAYPPASKGGECTVELLRNREVLVITIPARLLFAPNDVELKETATKYLTPIKRYLSEPDLYRVMLAMHTDNTGSDQYREELTADRVDAVYEWFETHGSPTAFLFPYALGDDMPLKPNTSMADRDANRRLEIYLVPGEKMLSQAKKGRIEF